MVLHLKCQSSQLLPQPDVLLMHSQINIFPQSNIFPYKNASVYFLSEPLSAWQISLQRNINSHSPYSLDRVSRVQMLEIQRRLNAARRQALRLHRHAQLALKVARGAVCTP